MAESHIRKIVFHIAREPLTGVWSLIKELAFFQRSENNIDARVIIFARKRKSNLYIDDLQKLNIPLVIFPILDINYSYWLLLLDNRLEKYLNTFKATEFDEIVLQFHNANLSGLLFPKNIKKLKKTKKIITIPVFHGTPLVFPKPGRLKLFLHRQIGRRLRNADKIVSVSNSGIKEMMDIFFYDENQICAIPNGIADPKKIHKQRESYSSIDPFVMGFVGALEDGKRWDLVIEAGNILFQKGYPVKTVIAGTGSGQEAVREFSNLHREWLVYLGYVPEAGINLIPTFDVLLLPSSYEGLPMTIIEALASGVPVICTKISDLPEMIQDLEAGYLVDKDAKKISSYIENLLTDHSLYRRFSINARNNYIERYSIFVCGNKYLNLYNKLFNNGSTAK